MFVTPTKSRPATVRSFCAGFPRVTLHRGHDPVAAEILVDLLEQAGVPARRFGGSPGAPFGSALVETRVDVPAEHEDEARRVLAAHAGAVALPDEEPAEPAADPALRPLLAAGVTPICPGAAHVYARRPLLGAVILAGQSAAIALMFVAGRRPAAAAALFACGLFLFDLVGGQLAVRAHNRGARRGRAWQLATGALVCLGLGGLAAVCAPLLERMQARRGFESRARDNEFREGAARPEQLPFPLHLDLRN